MLHITGHGTTTSGPSPHNMNHWRLPSRGKQNPHLRRIFSPPIGHRSMKLRRGNSLTRQKRMGGQHPDKAGYGGITTRTHAASGHMSPRHDNRKLANMSQAPWGGASRSLTHTSTTRRRSHISGKRAQSAPVDQNTIKTQPHHN